MREKALAQELLDKMRSKSETLRLEWEDLLRRTEERRQEWERHVSAVQVAERVWKDNEEAEVVAEPVAAPVDAAGLAVELSDLIIDFVGAQNHAERVRRIGAAAKANGRLLNTTKVIRLMIDRGEVKSIVKNMRPSIHKILADRPDLYAKVSSGTYDYIYVEADQEADPEPDQHTQVEQPCLAAVGEAGLGEAPCPEGNLISIENCEEEGGVE